MKLLIVSNWSYCQFQSHMLLPFTGRDWFTRNYLQAVYVELAKGIKVRMERWVGSGTPLPFPFLAEVWKPNALKYSTYEQLI